jgi:hypothetical protein
MKNHIVRIFRVIVLMGFIHSASGLAAEATLAGFAFAGDFKTAPERFPYSYRIFERYKSENSSLSSIVLKRSEGVANANIAIRPAESLVNLKNSDQALMVVLVLTDEVVSSENYGSYYKTFVNLRGDLLIFDYKAQTVVRTYPLSTVIFDATPEVPSEEQVQSFVERLLVDEDGQSLVSLFTRRLAIADLPKEGTKNLQISKVEVSPDALAQMPLPFQKNPKMAKTLVADAFASILSARAGVPLLPSSIGAVAGVMMMRLENGDDFNLKVSEGDYLFDLKINGFIKKKTEETNVGIAYVYGVYSSLRFYEPTLGTEYINSDLKNGETAIVPASQVSAEDFPGYKNAIEGLYQKFSRFFGEDGKFDQKWLGAAASAKDIESQLDAARNIIRSCK